MIYVSSLILFLLTFLSINTETKILDIVNIKKDNISQTFFKDVIKLTIRSIILITEEDENYQDFLVKLYQLSVPIYAMTMYNREIYSTYSQQHEICRDDSKLFLICKANFDRNITSDIIDFIEKLNCWKRRDRIVFLTDQSLISKAGLINIFKTCFKNWILNVALVPRNKDSTVYVLNPYSTNFISLQNSLVFKDNFLNVHGTKINISMFHEPVYARKKDNNFVGRDAEMAKAIMRHMNACYNYILPTDGMSFGTFNETDLSGAAKDIILNITQVAFNCRLLVPHYYKVEFVYFHDRDDLVVLIPKSSKEKTLLHIIPPLVWPILAILSLLIFLHLATTTRYTYCNILLIIILVITGRSIKEIRTNYFRVMYMSAMVTVFFISTIICCRVTSSSTVPQFHQEIQTLYQFVQTDYKIITTMKYSNLLSVSLNDEVKQHIFSKLEVIDSTRLKQDILECSRKVIICKNGLAKLALNKGGKKCYHKLKEHVVPSVNSYMVGYGSPLLCRLNSIIGRITDSGLNVFWKPHLTRGGGEGKPEEKHIKISLNFLLVAFQIYIGGIIISITAFACEVIFCKYKKCCV